MIRTMIMDFITNDPGYNGGDYTTQPPGLRQAMGMLFIMTSAPKVQHRQAPTRDKADSVIRAYLDQNVKTHDANDVVYAFNASRDYDPSPNLEKITARVLAINSADDFVNPPELGIVERSSAREEREVRAAADHRPDARARDAFAAGGLGIVPRRFSEDVAGRQLKTIHSSQPTT